MDLSIVITTRDRKQDLLDCVDSVKKSSFGDLTWEMLVVDDLSSDGTEKTSFDELRVKSGKIIHNKYQEMMVISRNTGAREARGDYVLFIDDDNIIDPDMIRILVDFYRKHPDYSVIGPSMYCLDDKKKYLDYQKIDLFTGHTVGTVDLSKSEVYETDGVPNVFMIKKEVFDKCGFFDEILIQTWIEPDFAMKTRRDGYKCGMIPAARTYHKVRMEDNYKPRSMGGMFNQKAYCLIRNRMVFISRYGNFLNKAVFISIFSLFWPLVYSMFAVIYNRRDLVRMYWMGFFDGLVYFFTGRMRNSLRIS